jgi:hypothetical protein
MFSQSRHFTVSNNSLIIILHTFTRLWLCCTHRINPCIEARGFLIPRFANKVYCSLTYSTALQYNNASRSKTSHHRFFVVNLFTKYN